MAESTLSLTYTDLIEAVGHMLGFRRDSTVYTSEETADCDDSVQSGYRQFIFPPVLPGQSTSHEWSFLSKQGDQETVDGTAEYDLPDDFGSLRGNFTVNETGRWYPIVHRDEEYLRILRARGDVNGRPRYCALRPKTFAAATGQRWTLIIWPDPTAAWTLQYRYNVLVGAISGTQYPLGGMPHAETVKQSCLADAELRMNDDHGIHWERFMVRLAASVAADGRLAPETLGYNADHSDGGGSRWERTEYAEYEGNTFGDHAP